MMWPMGGSNIYRNAANNLGSILDLANIFRDLNRWQLCVQNFQPGSWT